MRLWEVIVVYFLSVSVGVARGIGWLPEWAFLGFGAVMGLWIAFRFTAKEASSARTQEDK